MTPCATTPMKHGMILEVKHVSTLKLVALAVPPVAPKGAASSGKRRVLATTWPLQASLQRAPHSVRK